MKSKALLILMLAMISKSAFAGADASGKVIAVHVDNTSLKFQLQSSNIASFCSGGWAGLNIIVQKTDPQYAFYYGQVMGALKEGWTVYLGNISAAGSGVQYCDIAKTGYGIMVLK